MSDEVEKKKPIYKRTRFIVIAVIAALILVSAVSIAFTSDEQSPSSQISGEYLGDYSLEDMEFGTSTTVVVDSTVRTIVTNSLPNHETGSFPNSGNPTPPFLSMNAEPPRNAYPTQAIPSALMSANLPAAIPFTRVSWSTDV
jgi:hypothetical protein